jgi:hypothetical protein
MDYSGFHACNVKACSGEVYNKYRAVKENLYRLTWIVSRVLQKFPYNNLGHIKV